MLYASMQKKMALCTAAGGGLTNFWVPHIQKCCICIIWEFHWIAIHGWSFSYGLSEQDYIFEKNIAHQILFKTILRITFVTLACEIFRFFMLQVAWNTLYHLANIEECNNDWKENFTNKLHSFNEGDTAWLKKCHYFIMHMTVQYYHFKNG